MKVLLAEDSAMVRRSLIAMLSKIDGISSVEEAENGDQALGMIDTKDYDLVILDIKIPGTNGLRVLDHLSEKKDKPVTIVLTNYAIAPYRKKSMELGADHFLDKSLELKRFQEIVRSLSEKNGSEQKA